MKHSIRMSVPLLTLFLFTFSLPISAQDAPSAAETTADTAAKPTDSAAGAPPSEPADDSSTTTNTTVETEDTPEADADSDTTTDEAGASESPTVNEADAEPVNDAESSSKVEASEKTESKPAENPPTDTPADGQKVAVSHQAVDVQTDAPSVPKDDSADSKRHLFVVTYNMAKPGGQTAEFVDEFSFEGFGFEYRFLLKKKLSIGALFSWSTFEKKEVGEFNLDDNTTITGTRIKMVDLIQLAPSIHYYFTTQSSKAVPFVGMNMGPYYASHIIDWGWWFQKESTWQFGFSPEAGVRISGLPVPLYLAVRYSYSFKANTLKAQQYLGINIGIAFLK
ncbi:MAG: hypothetical protein JXX29_15465 [Deltaproteobacteria bacterium]|nr:hypothetical protein [Deltaproteobacteria bacterium]MBN2673081.1 hypothetical protein [Deltaproteobacteria bacterium]